VDNFTQEDFERLVQVRGACCLSLYMPTERVVPQTQQNPTRFKNLLAQAEARLASEYGKAPPEIEALLRPVMPLVNDAEFWRHQSDGLALFLTDEGDMTEYRLSLRFEEMVVLSDRLYVKPLLPILSGDGRFYVLALSQNKVRLLQGARYTMDELELKNIPQSLEDALDLDDTERHLHHTAVRAGGAGPGLLRSHGVGKGELEKEQIRRYFRVVNRGVCDFLGNSRAPLVLAGVEYLHPLYKEVNTYSHLVSDGIRGNPEEWSQADLHALAWPLVEPIFTQERQQALDAYHQLAPKNGASTQLETIIPASFYGRVDTLFVQLDGQLWGQFDGSTGALELHDTMMPGDRELLDYAAVCTLANGGTVYALDASEMPGDAPLAAVLRY